MSLPFDTLQTFSLSGEEEVPSRWWLSFNDLQLNDLIDSALKNNLSVKTVWHQLEEADAFVDATASARWPQLSAQMQSGLSVPEPDFVPAGFHAGFRNRADCYLFIGNSAR